MILEYIVCALVILAFGIGATWFAEQAQALKTGVSCRCGRRSAGLLVVDSVAARRHAEVLTEGCTRCRARADADRAQEEQQNTRSQTGERHVR